MKETIAIAIGPVVIAMMIVVAWCLPKLHMQKLDHEYRMAQHREKVEQSSHARYLELERASQVPSDTELHARLAEAEARQVEAEAEKIRAEIDREREYEWMR